MLVFGSPRFCDLWPPRVFQWQLHWFGQQRILRWNCKCLKRRVNCFLGRGANKSHISYLTLDLFSGSTFIVSFRTLWINLDAHMPKTPTAQELEPVDPIPVPRSRDVMETLTSATLAVTSQMKWARTTSASRMPQEHFPWPTLDVPNPEVSQLASLVHYILFWRFIVF